MKSDKMGIHVKKNVKNFLSTVFGRIARFEQTESKLHYEVNLTENIGLDNQVKKTLLEAEFRESQAFELIRKLQNC